MAFDPSIAVDLNDHDPDNADATMASDPLTTLMALEEEAMHDPDYLNTSDHASELGHINRYIHSKIH